MVGTANRKRKGKAKTGHGVSADVAAVDQKRAKQGRHEYRCTICSHFERYEIEQAFVDWVSPDRIGKRYGVSRDAVYRHAHALGLMEKRRQSCFLDKAMVECLPSLPSRVDCLPWKIPNSSVPLFFKAR